MTNEKAKNVMILAGEHSGDQRAAELVKQLKISRPGLHFYGMGGEAMRFSGVNVELDCSALGVIGFFEIIKLLPRILSAFAYVKKTVRTRRPDLLICIDYQAFNIRAAKIAHRLGIPVFFYVGPQIWASRSGRIKKYARYVDYLAVLFPFEVGLYKDCSNIQVKYVGHPLCGAMTKVLSKQLARDLLGIPQSTQLVVFMPGSRVGEVTRLLPVFCEVMGQLQQRHPEVLCIVARAETVAAEALRSVLDRFKLSEVRVVENSRCQALSAADYVVTASGTVTLEAALLDKPMVVAYKLNRMTYLMIRHFNLLKIPFISLVNIVSQRGLIKEFLQEMCSAENILDELCRLISDDAYRTGIHEGLHEVSRLLLKPGSNDGLSQWVGAVCDELD